MREGRGRQDVESETSTTVSPVRPVPEVLGRTRAEVLARGAGEGAGRVDSESEVTELEVDPSESSDNEEHTATAVSSVRA